MVSVNASPVTEVLPMTTPTREMKAMTVIGRQTAPSMHEHLAAPMTRAVRLQQRAHLPVRLEVWYDRVLHACMCEKKHNVVYLEADSLRLWE